MKVQTMSIVVGTEACNARCPFCIAGMTPCRENLPSNFGLINWRNFDIACRCAYQAGVMTVLLTGKGEPTLYPELITTYLQELSAKKYFPFIELQTNGILLGKDKYDTYLAEWYKLGLTTICISTVHYLCYENSKIYQPYLDKASDILDLVSLINKLHKFGFSVRLSCMLVSGYIDSANEFELLMDFCRRNKVEQLTVRPIVAPNESESSTIASWTRQHSLTNEQILDIHKYIDSRGHAVLELPHGATVYDVEGQNVCWANCITTNKSIEEMRQIIFFPDGRISYDWKYNGAILL
ncbi:MAG: radical SAM protein [Methanomassiliicoccales archaeon]|jgi:molybdenum cofactor biosynthesis enzyme MoaA